MGYNISMNVCALVILAVLLFYMHYKKKLASKQNYIFRNLILICLATTIVDIVSSIIIAQPYKYPLIVLYLINCLFFVLQNIIPFLYCYYIIKVVGKENHLKKNVNKVAFFSPIIISLICIALTIPYKIVFYFDENLTYSHGWAFYLLHIFAFYYILYGAIYVKLNKKIVSKDKRWALYSFVVMTMLPVIIQLFLPQQLLTNFATSICLLLILFTIQNPEEVLDATTGLFNKNAFNVKIEIAMASKSDMVVQYIYIKNINFLFGVFGFENMYSLLRKFGVFLNQKCHKNCEIYCIDDGKFVIVSKGFGYDFAYNTLKEIYQECKRPWKHKEVEIDLDVCAGIIECPDSADTVSSLYHCFDEIQHTTADAVVNISSGGAETSKRLASVEAALVKALENNLFQVYYQPIYSVKEKRFCSAEALIRLNDSELGFIPPDEFIAITERNGMIIKIGLLVFESVCKMISQHKDELNSIDYIEINLSVVQCMQNDLWKQLLDIMKKYDIPHNKINLEITESSAAYSFGTLVNNMKMLHKEGITFSLDDYGTGYSSVNYITELPFKIAKLDKSMVWSADDNEKSQIALESTVKMMKSLDLEIVAEGIETEAHKEKIIEMGCDFLQGYYFSKPVPKNEFLSILNSEDYVYSR